MINVCHHLSPQEHLPSPLAIFYFCKSEFKLWAAQLAQQDGHVHTLYHCGHSCFKRTFPRKSNLSWFLYSLYAGLELLMAFYTYQPWKLQIIQVIDIVYEIVKSSESFSIVSISKLRHQQSLGCSQLWGMSKL